LKEALNIAAISVAEAYVDEDDIDDAEDLNEYMNETTLLVEMDQVGDV
jgi:hypothetical protein